MITLFYNIHCWSLLVCNKVQNFSLFCNKESLLTKLESVNKAHMHIKEKYKELKSACARKDELIPRLENEIRKLSTSMEKAIKVMLSFVWQTIGTVIFTKWRFFCHVQFVVPENIYTGPSHQRDLKYISEIRGEGRSGGSPRQSMKLIWNIQREGRLG